MGREKREAHRSPSSLSDAFRDIPRHLARNANTPARRGALLNASVPWEMPIPTDWTAARVKQAKKSQRQRDLEEVRRIMDARLNGLPVTNRELEWALNIGELEEEMENEENRIGSASGDTIMWDDDMDQRSDSGSVTPTSKSTKENAGAGNTVPDMESQISSELTEVSNASALNPDNGPEEPQMLTRGQLKKAKNTQPIDKGC